MSCASFFLSVMVAHVPKACRAIVGPKTLHISLKWRPACSPASHRALFT